jgi:hypothetical protein
MFRYAITTDLIGIRILRKSPSRNSSIVYMIFREGTRGIKRKIMGVLVNFSVVDITYVGIVSFTKQLAPGQSFAIILKKGEHICERH